MRERRAPRAALALSALAWLWALPPASALAATPGRETVRAWDAYVAATEARVASELAAPSASPTADRLDAGRTRACLVAGAGPIAPTVTTGADGAPLRVPGGFVSHWRGSVHVPGIGLDDLLERLQHPDEHGPHQEDVVSLRVLARQPDRMRLAIRMTRRSIVSVTYDTVHDVVYSRHGRGRASSRSVATRIVEIDHPGTVDETTRPEGDDRGFLWRLNSYWRYEQTPGGVLVELESLALSRSIPFGLGALVRPIVDRITRESIARTLGALREAHAPDGGGGPSPACP